MSQPARRVAFAAAALVLVGATDELAKNGGDTDSLTFFTLGDWGGDDDKHPTRKEQLETEKGMVKVAQDKSPNFILGVGDNFYSNGIDQHNQDRFVKTFEDVYKEECMQVDWYFTAGNHDVRGKIQYQIDYSGKSDRWNFPDNFYTFKKQLPSGKTAKFVVFDSTELAGLSYHNAELDEFVKAPGPSNLTAAQNRWDWFEAELASSNDDYLFVMTHYPFLSVCPHGNHFESHRKLLAKYKVTAAFHGHEHCAEHIEEDGVYYVTNGAGGGGSWYSTGNLHNVQSDQLKWYMSKNNRKNVLGSFTSVTLTDSAMYVEYYSNEGKLLHSASPKAPRSSSPPTPSPSPPTPSPSPVPSGKFECQKKTKVRSGVASTNIITEVNNLSECETACKKDNKCLALYYHNAGSNCHLLGGSFSRDDWLNEVYQRSDYDTCFKTDSKSVVV